MKQKSLLLFMLLLALSACVPTSAEPTPNVTVPTLAVPTRENNDATPTVGPTVTPTAPTSTATAVPGSPDPVLTTQGSTNVRLGPGTIFGVAYVLPAETTTPIAGKNLDSTWWFISNHGLGVNGWVSAAVVTTRGDTGDVPFMAAPTLTPTPAELTPQRIQFEPGTISDIVDGELYPPQRDAYLFRAMAGQHVIIEIHSTADRANFMLNGVDDGQPYKRLENEERLWGMDLPLEQDYLLTVAAPANAPITEYSVELTIAPLDTLPPPSIGMEINNFRVTAVTLPDNGKQLTFHWNTSGGTSARILGGTAQRFQPVWDVALSGEMTVDIAQTLFRDPAMTLELRNEAGEFIAESVVVDWDCTNVYFFTPEPRRCPHPATAVPAAIQAFENGQMVWLESVEANNRLIVVLYNDGSLQSFTDTWQEGDPVDDPALEPPQGLFQPVRGFGKVWREQPGVRDKLGWAINLEQAFQATLQAEMVESIPVTSYLQLPDGRILHLPLDVPLGNWEQIN
jgi:hypothetical protein